MVERMKMLCGPVLLFRLCVGQSGITFTESQLSGSVICPVLVPTSGQPDPHLQGGAGANRLCSL